ncbi:MAG TPA: twin-arginine translocase TatA/TatE family subunit [Negativicutes bacterium]
MFNFSMPELALVLVIALVVFGPGKLPDVGKALGRGLQEFRSATNNIAKAETVTAEKMEVKEIAAEIKSEAIR